MDAHEFCHKLLHEQKLCTLATASLDGKPEAATVEFAADDAWNLYFESFPHYRKYRNITENPRASVVITHLPNTIQMDGTITELSGEEAQQARARCITKQGTISSFHNDPNIKFFRFTPHWIRVLVEEKYPPRYEVLRGA